jgi:hypothetical protein
MVWGQNFYFLDFDMTDTVLEILPEHITAIVVNIGVNVRQYLAHPVFWGLI